MAEHNQLFDSYQEWVNRADRWLTRHPRFDGDEWTRPGENYRAICFDAKGRICRRGAELMRARDENAFPVRWIWPHQAVAAAMNEAAMAEAVNAALAELDADIDEMAEENEAHGFSLAPSLRVAEAHRILRAASISLRDALVSAEERQ